MEITPLLSSLHYTLKLDLTFNKEVIMTNYFLIQIKEPVHTAEKTQLTVNNI